MFVVREAFIWGVLPFLYNYSWVMWQRQIIRFQPFLKLFNSILSPTLLTGSFNWTLTIFLEIQLFFLFKITNFGYLSRLSWISDVCCRRTIYPTGNFPFVQECVLIDSLLTNLEVHCGQLYNFTCLCFADIWSIVNSLDSKFSSQIEHLFPLQWLFPQCVICFCKKLSDLKFLPHKEHTLFTSQTWFSRADVDVNTLEYGDSGYVDF